MKLSDLMHTKPNEGVVLFQLVNQFLKSAVERITQEETDRAIMRVRDRIHKEAARLPIELSGYADIDVGRNCLRIEIRMPPREGTEEAGDEQGTETDSE